MGVSSSESHDLTAFYELLTASFGVPSQNTGFYPSLDRIIETMLGPLNLGPGGRSYNEPISRLQRRKLNSITYPCSPILASQNTWYSSTRWLLEYHGEMRCYVSSSTMACLSNSRIKSRSLGNLSPCERW